MTEAQWNPNDVSPNGVVYQRSQCKMADITDGASNTFLIGERNCNPDWYYNGVDYADDQGWIEGYDWDTNRFVLDSLTVTPSSYLPPLQDTPGLSYGHGFGSARQQLQHGILRWFGAADQLHDRRRHIPSAR